MTDFSKLSTEELIRIAGVRGLEVSPQKPSVPPTVAAKQLEGAKRDESLYNTEAALRGVKEIPGRIGNALLDFGHGVADIGIGSGQLFSYLGGRMGATDAEKNYSDFIREREAGIAERRGPNAGPNVARMTGNVVPTLGIAGPAAATLPARMAQGTKLGATLGLTQTVDPDSPGPMGTGYLGSKTAQVTGGGVVGGLAPPLVEGLVRGAGASVNALVNTGRGLANRASGAINPQSIESTLTVEMQRNGVDWAQLPQAVRQSVLSQVQSALSGGGSVNPESVRRLADFTRLGMQPLSGQISRDPAQFALEQNLAKMEVGRPLADRLTQQNQQLIGNLDVARRVPGDQYGLGQNVISGLVRRDAPAKDAVSAAYGAARDHLGRAAPMDANAFSTRANLSLDEQMLGAYLPNEVRTILNNVSSGQIPFNVNTAVQIDRVLSSAQRSAGQGTPQSLAIGRVRDALNSAPIADTAGEGAKAAFDAARGAAATRFGRIERTPALKAAIDETVAPEKFIEKYAIRGTVEDTANFVRNLPIDARNDLRSGVIDWIRSKAVTGTEDTAKFSQAGFNRALQSIGDRKLDLIFAGDRNTLETLRAIGRTSSLVQSPPVASGVNYSGSATTLLDALDKATRLPILGPLLGKPSDMARATQVSRALGGSAPVTPPQDLVPQELLRRIAGPGGVVAAPLGVTGILGAVQ